MADITALCPRVLLIHQGALFHDGPLEQLAARLAPCRQVRLELAEPPTAEALAPFGDLECLEGRAASLLVPRDRLTAVVAQVLARFEVLDLEVSDPPIEELIGGLFRDQPSATGSGSWPPKPTGTAL
jgi:ABC-2 type transport system ATP-binding protein